MANASTCGLYVGDSLAAYGFPGGHPFSTQRQAAFLDEAARQDLLGAVRLCAPVMASRDELGWFHAKPYVAEVVAASARGGGFLDDGDTPAFFGCYEAAATVVGSALDAARRMMGGELARAFIPIAGLHHATQDRAAGFCIFSDIGAVVEALRREFQVRSIAYVDIDAHHGDGVFDAFEADPDLCLVDIHQAGDGFYPGTGAATETGIGAARETKMNLPLAAGSGPAAFYHAFARAEPFLRAARPEVIILQAGADSLAGDPLAGLAFSADCHGYAASRLRALAEDLGHGRLLALGGGGYALSNVAAAWTAVLRALI